jgi:hypothetical protein
LREHILPDPIRELYESRWQEAAEFHSVWVMLQQLFDGTAKNARLIRHTGASFFMAVRKAMRDSIVLSVARLTDPPRTGRKENASLPALLEKTRECGAPALVVELELLMGEIKTLAEPIRDRRNRALAHADLETALLIHPDPLPGISFALLEELSSKIADFLNRITRHFLRSETRFTHPVMSGDAKTLLFYLEKALDAEDAERAKHGIDPLD